MSPDRQPRIQQEEIMHPGEYQPQAVLVGVQEEARKVAEAAAQTEAATPRFRDSDFSQSLYVLR